MSETLRSVVKKDLSIPTTTATLLSIVFGLPLAGILMGVYIGRWGAVLNISIDKPVTILYYFIGFITIMILGAVVHELIHAITWALFGHKPLRAIKFGFQWQTFTPYAHCPEPMEVQAYRLGGSMPLIILGILPSLIGIITGDGWSMVFGSLFTLAAGGDMLVLWLIRDVKPGQLVLDHPTRVGCYVIEPGAD